MHIVIIIIIIFSAIIIIAESSSFVFFNLIVKVEKKPKPKKNPVTIENLNKTILNKFYTNKDIKIEYPPGIIMVDDYNNVFINVNNKIIMLDKDVIYNIKDNFSLEIINLNGKLIEYYYKSII